MRGDGGAADVELLVFYSWGKVHHAINEYQLRCPMLPLACVLYYIFIYLFTWVLYFASWGVKIKLSELSTITSTRL